MIKKFIVSLLMVVAVICGINFGIANTTTNTAYAAESDASAFKIASVSPYDLYPTGTEANVPLKIMEGDDEICTIMIDQGLEFVKYDSPSYSCLRILKNSSIKIIPNDNAFSVKKVIVQSYSSSTINVNVDAAYGTKDTNLESLTDEERNILGDKYSILNVAPFELNSEYAATEANPYVLTTGSQFFLKSIHVVYERLSYSATVYPKTGSYDSLDAGHFNVKITNIGYADSTGVMILTGSQIIISHAPGYVINSVVLGTTYSISISGEPAFTYEKTEEGSWTLTGFPISSSYVINNISSQGYHLSSITINYDEHEHISEEEYVDGRDDTYHFKQCECLYRINEELHTFDEGEVILEPTHQKKGKVKYTCTNADCGYEKEEQLAPNLADVVVELTDKLSYNGKLQTQGYKVFYNGVELPSYGTYYTANQTNRGKNPGEYTFTIVPKPDSIFEGSQEVSFTISKGNVAKPTADSTVFTYNGNEQTYVLATSDMYSISGVLSSTNPGVNKVYISLNDKEFYQWEDGSTEDLVYDFIINKASYDMSKVVFENKTVTYNGSEFLIEATNLPNGVSVTYENNVGINAGTYNAVAKFTGDTDKYELIDDMTAVLTINKAVVTAPTADTTVFTYNGQEQTYSLAENGLYTISNTNATNAGDYTITVALVDKNNYQWDNQSSDDLAYSFVINKAVYDMNGISFVGKTVTYNANEYKVEITGELPAGVSVSYVENKGTVAGTYNAVAKFTGDAVNYELIDDMTAVLIINKVVVTAPTADTTVFTYNGQEQTYSLAENALYTISNTNATNAGDYTITVALVDKNNYQWDNQSSDDLAYSFVINKAVYDMSEVVFEDKAVVYTGNAFSIEATNLPTGVSVEYQNNGKTEIGEYTIIAKFTGDVENYELIDNMTATLTIKKATFTFDTNTQDGNAEDIIISSSNGVDPNKELVVKLVESEKTDKDYKEFIDKNQKVAVAYDVKLLEDGVSVQPDGTLQFKILIPTKLVGKDFTILHIHNGNEATDIEYQIEGDYVVFESDTLSEFVFVYESNFWFWFIIILIAVILLAGILVVVL